MNFDLSQAECRILAFVAEEERMMKVFESGGDIYRDAAAGIFDVPYEHTAKSYEGGAALRKDGKRTVLGCNYKMGYQRFATENMLSFQRAKFLLDGYLKTYPGIPNYWHKIEYMLRRKKLLVNCAVGEHVAPRSRLFMGPMTQETFNDAYAWLPQSTVADMINERALKFIYYDQKRFSHIKLQTQEHDGFRFQVSFDTPYNVILESLRLIRDELEKPIWYDGRSFVIPCDFSCGLNVRDMEEGITLDNENEFAAKLESFK